MESEQRLLEKLRLLPPDKISQVEDFIDFLYQRLYTTENLKSDRALTQAATKLSEPSFAKIWNNPDDAEYDQL